MEDPEQPPVPSRRDRLRAWATGMHPHTRRRLKLLLIVGGAVIILGGAFLWALPEIVRRAVVTQVPKAIGRAVSLEDVDLNLFTGRLALKRLRIAEQNPDQTFVAAERVELRVSPFSLVLGHVRLAYVTLTAPRIRIVRTGPVEFNFSDLLARLPPTDPNKPKSRWTVSVGRFGLVDGAVSISDRAVSPARDWEIQGITMEGGGLTTEAAQQPGHLDFRARVNNAAFDANSASIVLTPVGLAMHLTLDQFDLTQVLPYLPPGLPVTLQSGTLGLGLEVSLARSENKLTRAAVSGDIRVDGLALAQSGQPAAFVKLPKVSVAIKDADLITRSLTIASIDADGLDVRAVRDQSGNVDLLALAGPHTEATGGEPPPHPAPAPPPGPPAASAAPAFKARLEKLTLRSGTVTLTDQAVSPTQEWRLQGLTIEGAGLGTTADDSHGTLKVAGELKSAPGPAKPAAVSFQADSLRLVPATVNARVTLEGFDLAVLGPYWPATLPAVVSEGSLGATVSAAVERGDTGLSRGMASGTVRLDALKLVRRGQTAPFATIPKLTVGVKEADIVARTVTVETIGIEGMDVRAVRDAKGTIDLMELATTTPTNGAKPDAAATRAAPTPAAAATPAASSPAKSSATAKSAARPAEPEWRVTLERFDFTKGSVKLEDQAVSPAMTHALTNVTVNASHLTWPPEKSALPAGAGALRVLAQLDSSGGARKAASLAVHARPFRAVPLAATARVALDDLNLGALSPYLPPSLPVLVRDGTFGLKLNGSVEMGQSGLKRAETSGSVRLDGLAVVRRDGAGPPFLTVPTLTVEVKQADAIGRTVALGTIAVDGVDAHIVRERTGVIDIEELIAPVPPAAPAQTPASPPGPSTTAKPAPAPATAAGRPWRLDLDRFVFTKGTGTLEDQTVTPVVTLTLTDIAVTVEQVAWPSTRPATFEASLGMPGGGRSEVKGRGKLEPLDVQVRISTRDASVEPYQPYFPFPARFFGFFSGDSLSEIQRAKDGTLILASRGEASTRDFEIRPPDADTAVIRLKLMAIKGIDFSWPNYALVDSVALTEPHAEIERDAKGEINVVRLFTSKGAGKDSAKDTRKDAAKDMPKDAAKEAPKDAAKDAAAPAADQKSAVSLPTDAASKDAKGSDKAPTRGPQDMIIDINELTLAGGYLRFLDRTTTPAFSEDVSDLTVTVNKASNQLGRQHTTMTARSTIGGDGQLRTEGQMSGKADTLNADVSLTLKDLALPAVNPYAVRATGWQIQRGKLSSQMHYRFEGDHIVADHDLKFAGLQVARAPSTDAPQRLGVPLGLAVALLKDRHGNIDLTIPLRGTLSDRKFDWSEAMWVAARQVIVKLVVSPFNAIGRAFTGGGGDKVEKLEVDPVTFAAGSATISPAMEAHLTRVADFMRRAPAIRLGLEPMASASDVEALKAREVTARLERLKSERGLRDLPEALRVYYMAQVKDVALPPTVEEQLAVLARREPVPAGPLAELLKQRTETTRDRLVKAEGIPADRLTTDTPSGTANADAAGEGRVEFAILAAAQ